MKASRICQWEIRNENMFFPSLPTTKRLPAGVYEIRNTQHVGFHLLKQTIQTESIVDIPVPEIQNVLNDIKTFWEKREIYKTNNLVYKRGVLLFGPAGSGKSYVVQQIMKYVIEEKDGIVISLVSAQCVDNYVEFVPSALRAIESERPIIVVIEEIESIIDRGFYDTGIKLLNILDGLRQVTGGICYCASTNYIERLKDHFQNRPGRFDVKIKIGLPSDEVRLCFLQSKLSPEQQKQYDLKKWVADTKHFSLAHMKELIISVVIMNNDYSKTISNLKAMSQKVSSKDDDFDINKIGF